MITRNQAKVTLKNRGWSQRQAAPALGVTFTHLNLVLNGRRESRRLLEAVAQIPERSALALCAAQNTRRNR